MFTRIWNSITYLSAAAAAAPSTEIKELGHQQRLDKVGYRINPPRSFEDCILGTILENPVYLNNKKNVILEQSSLKSCFVKVTEKDGFRASVEECFKNPFTNELHEKIIREDNPSSDFTPTKLRAIYTEHTELKNKISTYVNLIEHLHDELHSLIAITCPIDDLAEIFQDDVGLLKNYTELQKQERVELVTMRKTELIEHLSEFINFVTAIILEDKDQIPSVIDEQKNEILEGPILLRQLFINELQSLANVRSELRYDTLLKQNYYYADNLYHRLINDPLTGELITHVESLMGINQSGHEARFASSHSTDTRQNLDHLSSHAPVIPTTSHLLFTGIHRFFLARNDSTTPDAPETRRSPSPRIQPLDMD